MDLQFIFVALGAFGSFAGSWFAIKVHLQYLRRDIDFAHKRIDDLNAKRV